jgi:invasion protein IalB
MQVRARSKNIVRYGIAALTALVLFAHEAKAQKVDDGTEPVAAEPEDDGFRPVWQQQAKAAAARAKQQLADKQAGTVQPDMTVYDRWTVTCQNGDHGKRCAAALRIVNAKQELVILWQIGRTSDGKVLASIQTPTGVMVKQGVDLKVGDARIGRLDYAACVPQNCEAAGVLDEALIRKISASQEMMITIHARDGRDVNFKFPVGGADKAMAAVRS